MTEWCWADAHWRERVGPEPADLLREALRRAVDIRDRSAEGAYLSVRPLILVDVLNALCEALGVDTTGK